jgi:pyrroloquinoline quinone (PQQ) biosynthesis protein C
VFVEHEFYQQINAPGLNVQQIKCYTWLYSTTAQQVPNRMVQKVAKKFWSFVRL